MIIDGYLVGRTEEGVWTAEDPVTREVLRAETHAELLIKIDQKVHPERCFNE